MHPRPVLAVTGHFLELNFWVSQESKTSEFEEENTHFLACNGLGSSIECNATRFFQ